MELLYFTIIVYLINVEIIYMNFILINNNIDNFLLDFSADFKKRKYYII